VVETSSNRTLEQLDGGRRHASSTGADRRSSQSLIQKIMGAERSRPSIDSRRCETSQILKQSGRRRSRNSFRSWTGQNEILALTTKSTRTIDYGQVTETAGIRPNTPTNDGPIDLVGGNDCLLVLSIWQRRIHSCFRQGAGGDVTIRSSKKSSTVPMLMISLHSTTMAASRRHARRWNTFRCSIDKGSISTGRGCSEG